MSAILQAYSIEATTKDALAIGRLPQSMPQPAAVFVPYLHEENDKARVNACAAIREAGLEPVPHLSARRLGSAAELDRLLGELRAAADVTSLFLIAGDVTRPSGPFLDSLSILRSGLIERHGFRSVGIAGHPDGHPDVNENVLWDAMLAKITEIESRGLASCIVTQFSFDAQRVLRWLVETRRRGVKAPVRIGIPGPTGVRTLLRYATRCGVSASASAIAKYGLSLGRLLGDAGPDAFLEQLSAGLEPAVTGQVHLHLFPFGGFGKVAEWMEQFSRRHPPATCCTA